MKVLFIDCFSGISGDMLLGALVDAGLSPEDLKRELDRLGLDGYDIFFEKTTHHGLSGVRAHVKVGDCSVHRNLADIETIITSSSLDRTIQEDAIAVFRRLAEAEAAVHGVTVDKIHFHEVGALDAVVDIVGTVCGLKLLGIDVVFASEFRFGTGTVTCAHGVLPVPVPAVVRLTRGFPARITSLEGELTTPTGAAIVTTLAREVGAEPSLVIESSGYGFGSRERPKGEIPNTLRVLIGRMAGPGEAEEVFLLETNLDDVIGQDAGYLMERCFEAGALDVFHTAIQMKKSRPGIKISVLAARPQLDRVRGIVVAESGTLGVRVTRCGRHVASRSMENVSTSLGTVRVKRFAFPGTPERYTVEYDDLARIARDKGIPLREARARVQRDIDQEGS